MDDSAASPRISRIQRTALILMVVGGMINYVDRSTLAIGLPLIRRDIGLSLTQSGVLLSAFLWAYAFMQLPAGAFVDRVGARLAFSAGLFVWSLAQILGGLVGTFRQFFGVRLLLGIGESPQYPTCARIVSDWFHERERGFATGVWNCSSSMGTAISAPLLTFLMLHLGWRWMFISMGIVGVLVAGIVRWLHRDPRQVRLTPKERSYLSDEGEETPRVSFRDWRDLFHFRTTWGMILGFFGAVYTVWLYNAWLPQYLEIEWHLSVKATGWIAAIPFLFGVLGSLAGGRFCDMLVRRHFSPVTSRKIPIVGSLLGSAFFTLLVANTASAFLAVTYISASLFLLYVCASSAWAMATVAAPKHCAASIGSIQNFGGYLGGALAPIATGWIVDRMGSFRPALIVGALVAVAAAIAHFALVRGPVQLRPGARA